MTAAQKQKVRNTTSTATTVVETPPVATATTIQHLTRDNNNKPLILKNPRHKTPRCLKYHMCSFCSKFEIFASELLSYITVVRGHSSLYLHVMPSPLLGSSAPEGMSLPWPNYVAGRKKLALRAVASPRNVKLSSNERSMQTERTY
jgi:hypothetical protein